MTGPFAAQPDDRPSPPPPPLGPAVSRPSPAPGSALGSAAEPLPPFAPAAPAPRGRDEAPAPAEALPPIAEDLPWLDLSEPAAEEAGEWLAPQMDTLADPGLPLDGDDLELGSGAAPDLAPVLDAAEAPDIAPAFGEPGAAPDDVLDEVAGRLERLARALRSRRTGEILAGGGAPDPLELLVAGYTLGYSEAARRARQGDRPAAP